MKLSSDKDTMAELKALILYILYKINKPITNDEFLKLVLTITDINYFYFQQFLLDLMAAEKYAAAHRLEERCAAALAVMILSVFPTPAVPSA